MIDCINNTGSTNLSSLCNRFQTISYIVNCEIIVIEFGDISGFGVLV